MFFKYKCSGNRLSFVHAYETKSNKYFVVFGNRERLRKHKNHYAETKTVVFWHLLTLRNESVQFET